MKSRIDEELKARRIVQEVVHYFFKNKVYDMNLKLAINDEEIKVIAEGHPQQEPNDLEEVTRLLNARRAPELEDYYDQLLGIGYNDNDINLLGAIVDEGIISYDGDILTFFITRKLRRDK